MPISLLDALMNAKPNPAANTAPGQFQPGIPQADGNRARMAMQVWREWRDEDFENRGHVTLDEFQRTILPTLEGGDPAAVAEAPQPTRRSLSDALFR